MKMAINYDSSLHLQLFKFPSSIWDSIHWIVSSSFVAYLTLQEFAAYLTLQVSENYIYPATEFDMANLLTVVKKGTHIMIQEHYKYSMAY